METERLIIRRFQPEDWLDLYEYLSDPQVVLYEPYEVYNQEECKKVALERSQNEAFWAVCLKDTGKVIGNLYFQKREFDWVIGYVFNSAYQGMGYATEAAKAMLNYGFTTLGARRIVAMCNPINVKSWHLMERLHMRREGHLVKNIYFKTDEQGNPIWVDTYEYALLATEWLL